MFAFLTLKFKFSLVILFRLMSFFAMKLIFFWLSGTPRDNEVIFFILVRDSMRVSSIQNASKWEEPISAASRFLSLDSLCPRVFMRGLIDTVVSSSGMISLMSKKTDNFFNEEIRVLFLWRNVSTVCKLLLLLYGRDIFRWKRGSNRCAFLANRARTLVVANLLILSWNDLRAVLVSMGRICSS